MPSAELREPVRPGIRRQDHPAGSVRTLDGLFTRAARRHPRAVVVREGPHILSYGKADLLSAQLATALLRADVQLGDPVVVHGDDHRRTLVAHLAVMKVGGVCLPVPRGLPASRARRIAVVSGAGTVLCTSGTQEVWRHDDRRRFVLDDPELWKRLGARPPDRALPRSAPAEPAYLLTAGEGGAWSSAHLVDHRAWHLAMAARSEQTGPAGQTVTVTEHPTGPATLSAMWWAFGSGSTLHARPGEPVAGPDGGVAVYEPEEYARVLDALAREPRPPRPRMVLLVGAPCTPELAARHVGILPDTVLRAEFAPGGSVLPWAVSTHPAGQDVSCGASQVLGAAPGVRLTVRGALGENLRAGQAGEVCAQGRTLPFDVIGDGFVPGRGGALLRSGFAGRRNPDGDVVLTGLGPAVAPRHCTSGEDDEAAARWAAASSSSLGCVAPEAV
ncbi:long-chain fatty acid--CoA ligase [Streptomyces phaeoluteigriseus]|uniref:Long-chain fatty acid--CoA ligase n=1 Tax=Streptomyces phaeoluteigriseus TaxID=114686 RepID=A0ABY4Z9I4_9ACTN|nr:AMP-binding protein [Streptomyces phaeoluteigriseus]USQ85704.1 long-chain fatty acid--CoA ligase [Streptomyces phaeoluteigriseus]